MSKKKVIIIGGGPAALMAAEQLSPDCEVHLYEKEKTVGRKFLVAGKGGFNLTNNIDGHDLLPKYSPASFLEASLLNFGTKATRKWLSEMNIPTFSGTSGRVFPEQGIKPIQVLQQIKNKLEKQGVQIYLQHEFIKFGKKHQLILQHKGQLLTVEADVYIFALGGASWSKTGSNGLWTTAFEAIGISSQPFQSSNCGLNMDWPKDFLKHHEGKPLKNLKISIEELEVKGEALVTKYGLEGNAIYPIVGSVRRILDKGERPIINLDLKPYNTATQLIQKLPERARKTKDYAKALHLNSLQMALLKAFTTKKSFSSPLIFVKKIKKLAVPVDSLRPIEEAISSVGGIPISALSSDFSLKKHPHIYTIGEMVDWDAPTGGFLLQGCFSMGAWVAKAILSKI